MFIKHSLSKDTIILDALRGCAALLVLLSHADAYYLIRYDPLLPYKGHLGEIGVYVFFILSGFLIWTSAERVLPKDGGLTTYLVHRAARIMPLYYVSLAFAVVAFPALSSFATDITPYTVARHIVFSQSLDPSVSRAINPILWTLTHEAVFYCLVPFLFLGRRFFPAVVGLMLLGTWWGWTHAGMFSPFLRLCFLFAIGMTLAQYKVAPTRAAALVTVATAATLGAFGFSHMIVNVAWAVGLFCAASALRDAASSWPLRGLAFVGVVSYSLYIWHYMLIEIVGPLLLPYRPYDHPVLTGIGFMALCLGLSWVSYRCIEKPGQAWLREAMTARRRMTAAPSRAL
ncbi:acyltransferase family protein [Microvirga roseola]|uniref:acyltransferase family protein n=1 Tax=Microvirga roseola TaxID=2883126 RepID=UPI001E493B35|nr:acyltransferase [Microvirga roseola]